MVPNMPTPEESTRHELVHIQRRGCAVEQGKVDGFFLKKKTLDDSAVKGVACEYCFMGDVVKVIQRTNVACLCWFTNSTRILEECAVKATAEDLEQSGMCRCLYISDGQYAVHKLKETVEPVDVVFESSGAAESQQNESVE